MTVEKPNGFRFSNEISLGALLHIVVMFAFLIGVYFRFTGVERAVATITGQTTRIEHYLSSQDKDYWKKVHENGDN